MVVKQKGIVSYLQDELYLQKEDIFISITLYRMPAWLVREFALRVARARELRISLCKSCILGLNLGLIVVDPNTSALKKIDLLCMDQQDMLAGSLEDTVGRRAVGTH